MSAQFFSCSHKERLFSGDPETYGENYQSHCLEIYKHYADMAERVNARIWSILAFFVPVGTSLIAAVAAIPKYIEGLGSPLNSNLDLWVLIISVVAGFTISATALRILFEERKTQSKMYNIIREIETVLPLAPYGLLRDMEMRETPRPLHREFKELSLPHKYFEILIPILFLLLLIIVVVALYPPASS